MMKMLHATLLSLIVTSIAPASAQGSPGAIFSFATSGCLDVRNGIFQDGTPVQIYDCNESAAQNWTMSTGPAEIGLTNTNFCLDAINVDTGNKVVISGCNEAPQQQWNFTDFGGPIQLNGTNLCLDIPTSSTTNGEQVQTSPCNGGDNQFWLKT
ncbi:ricin B-like lectin [Phlegmacium glaucopus]|nr:ricin B-like lectin [Phlegmacium glaucopus]